MQLTGSNAAQFHTRQLAASALPASCSDFLATQGTLLREEAQSQVIVAVALQSQLVTLKAIFIQLARHGTLHYPSQPKTTCHHTHAAHLALGQPLLDALCMEDVIARQQTNLIGRL